MRNWVKNLVKEVLRDVRQEEALQHMQKPSWLSHPAQAQRKDPFDTPEMKKLERERAARRRAEELIEPYLKEILEIDSGVFKLPKAVYDEIIALDLPETTPSIAGKKKYVGYYTYRGFVKFAPEEKNETTV